MRRILTAALDRLAFAAARCTADGKRLGVLFAFAVAGAVLVAGCGLKGDLYLPEEAAPGTPPPADVGQDEEDGPDAGDGA